MSIATKEGRSESLEGALHGILDSFVPDKSLPYPEAAQMAVHIAALLQRRAADLQTPQEYKQQSELDRMIRDASDGLTPNARAKCRSSLRRPTPSRAASAVTVSGASRFSRIVSSAFFTSGSVVVRRLPAAS